MSILKLENVAYRYEGAAKNVLKNLNAAFEQGMLYAIVGKSGAGKSTLLSLLSGLDLCMEGSVVYNGQDMKQLDRDDYRAKDIGVIFQGYNLLTNATAADNVELALNIGGVKIKDKKKQAYMLLEKVGIDRDTADRMVLKLSGGEQQRVGIARALSHDPDVIIADEPTGNLDGDTEKTIMDILSGLARDENKCVIVVTHSKKVSEYADELYYLNDGSLEHMR